jgi:hypothetical protein
MNLKQFLKPDWRKIVVFAILVLIGIAITHPLVYPELSYSFPFLPFPLEVVEIRMIPCPPHEPGTPISDCVEYFFIYRNILLNFFSYYFITCFIIWVYDKLKKKV